MRPSERAASTAALPESSAAKRPGSPLSRDETTDDSAQARPPTPRAATWQDTLGIPSDPHEDTLQAYESGYFEGWRAGREAAHADIEADWARMAKRIVATATATSHAELERRRAVGCTPCRARCGRCSVCIRAAAIRRNRGDWPGQQSGVDGSA